MRSKFALLAAVSLLAGCGGEEDPSEPTTGPLVSYQRSGGIAGVLEELRVEADGQAVLIVGPERKRSSFELDDAELGRLRSELEAADLSDPPGRPGDPGCADCFGYRVEYEGHEVTLDDLDRPPETLTIVLDHLGRLVAANYPPS